MGPAGVFRNLLIGLMTLVEKGTAEQVKIKAIDALRFARRHNWADQEVVVTMLLAGALLKEKRFDSALNGYRRARQVAEKVTVEGHPAGRDLVLQTWFGQASAHLAAGQFEEAANCYDQAAILAQQIPNLILGIEAFRMGCFCFNRLDESAAAQQLDTAIAGASEAFKRLCSQANGLLSAAWLLSSLTAAPIERKASGATAS
ncbi:MAG: tetratricopeptide repeat protein [Methylococcales bacterium]